MYREEHVSAPDLPAAVASAAASREPAGAFASATEVTYLFAGAGEVLALVASRASGAPFAALAGTYPVFDWDEREMRDAEGVPLVDAPVPRPLFADGDEVPAALTAEGRGLTELVVGPVHAGIIEPGRFTFTSGGESVVVLDAQFSYARRGVEAFLAGRDAVGAAGAVGRICGACSVARTWAYCRAVEALAGVTCDGASEHARLAFAELERIYNHVFDLASASAGAGYGYGQTQGLALKECVHVLCAEAAGHRLLFDAIVPGGVRDGVLDDPRDLRLRLQGLREDAAEFVAGLFGNRSVAHRFADAGIVRRETALAFGAVGPAARASGATADVRRDLPYGAYRTLVPAGASERAGDVAARCRVKAAELDDAFALADAALAELGASVPPAPRTPWVAAGRVATATEGPRGRELVCVAVADDGTLARFHAISASYRNWPLVVRAMDRDIVPDFPLVNKSFNLCYACADR